MTTLNNDELREQIFPNWRYSKPKTWRRGIFRKSRPTRVMQNQMTEAEMRNVMKRVATHDKQLLEAILDGKQEATVRNTNPKTRMTRWYSRETEAVPVEHIKSVFNKEGE